jgi:hypothetical protein
MSAGLEKVTVPGVAAGSFETIVGENPLSLLRKHSQTKP